MPRSTVAKAVVVPYRPAAVRARILERARYFRRLGRRFSRRATMELLRRLGAGRTSIEGTVGAAPLPETVAARERRSSGTERRAEIAHVTTAIREKIEMQLAEISAPAPRQRRTRVRVRRAHPDQLVLAL